MLIGFNRSLKLTRSVLPLLSFPKKPHPESIDRHLSIIHSLDMEVTSQGRKGEAEGRGDTDGRENADFFHY